MSRIGIIQQLYNDKTAKPASKFNYDALKAPPISAFFTPEDVGKLYKIATSLRYSANVSKKYELIDEIMESRGFRRAHCGTNRIVYDCLYSQLFVAKVAIDKVGVKDSPAEFVNQEMFKPFCCKIFEVDPSGVLAFVEKVNPITSIEEFNSVSKDIFKMMTSKIIGRFVVDDLGMDKFMNYGLRYDTNTGHIFGPVIIDFPYAYELNDKKLICQKLIPTPFGDKPCCGDIDYDETLSNLICTKCGKRYTALDLKKDSSDILLEYIDKNKNHKGAISMRVRVKENGKVIFDSGISSKKSFTEEEMKEITSFSQVKPGDEFTTDINDVRFIRPKPKKVIIQNAVDEIRRNFAKSMNEKEQENISKGKTYVSTLNNNHSDNIDNECESYTFTSVISNILDDGTIESIIDNSQEEEKTVDESIVIMEENHENEQSIITDNTDETEKKENDTQTGIESKEEETMAKTIKYESQSPKNCNDVIDNFFAFDKSNQKQNRADRRNKNKKFKNKNFNNKNNMNKF